MILISYMSELIGSNKMEKCKQQGCPKTRTRAERHLQSNFRQVREAGRKVALRKTDLDKIIVLPYTDYGSLYRAKN